MTGAYIQTQEKRTSRTLVKQENDSLPGACLDDYDDNDDHSRSKSEKENLKESLGNSS